MFNLIIIISKKNEEIESVKKQLHLNDNKNKDLILQPLSLINKANSTPLSLSLNLHQYNNNLNNLSINTEFSSSEISKFKKAKSSKILKLKFLKLKNIEQQKKTVNNPD